MSGCSFLPSSHSPIPRCWGWCSLQAWGRGRGHLWACRAPPGGCCYLWSPPSPEWPAPSPARGKTCGEYLPAGRPPWRSSGSAPWKPCCVLKETTRKGNENSFWTPRETRVRRRGCALTEVHVEEAVRVDGGLVRGRGVIGVLDVGVLVGGVRGRRLLEMKRSALSIIGQMQGREAGAKGVRAVVKAGDSSPEVKVVHWQNNRQTQTIISCN